MNYEDMYTTDFLATLPEVDSKRIGCMGFSMGAYRAWMLSALSDKVKAGAAVCWMVTTDCQFSWEYSGKPEQGRFCPICCGVSAVLRGLSAYRVCQALNRCFLNGELDVRSHHPADGSSGFHLIREC